MATKQFKNLNQLAKFIKDTVPSKILSEKKVENLLRNELRKSIIDVVYNAYEPEKYDRRKSDGGLADPRLMQIVDALVDGDTFKIVFQSIAEGNDTLKGEYLSETIIEGIKENWENPNGEWSEPRDFISAMYANIKSNPKPLIRAVKQAFIKCGFKVR